MMAAGPKGEFEGRSPFNELKRCRRNTTQIAPQLRCYFVEYRGVEPLTYRLRTYRSSQLS